MKQQGSQCLHYFFFQVKVTNCIWVEYNLKFGRELNEKRVIKTILKRYAFWNVYFFVSNKLHNKWSKISPETLGYIVTWGCQGPLDQISYTVLYISTFNVNLSVNILYIYWEMFILLYTTLCRIIKNNTYIHTLYKLFSKSYLKRYCM